MGSDPAKVATGERFRSLAGSGVLYVRKHQVKGVVPALLHSVAHRLGLPGPKLHFRYFPELTDNPLTALDRSGRLTPVIEVSFDRLRPYAVSVPFSDFERNPFTRTSYEYIVNETYSYDGSALQAYYDHWQPQTLGDVYRVPEAHNEVLSGPPTPDSLPWTRGAWPDHLAAGRTIHDQRMRERLGPESEPHGYRSFGPVSRVAGERFFEDYVGLADSISRDGYRPGLGQQPLMELLTDGVQWAGRVLAGNHRCAVMAALNSPAFLIAVSRHVVRRHEAPRWPGVRSGLYTESQARSVFDDFLFGR